MSFLPADKVATPLSHRGDIFHQGTKYVPNNTSVGAQSPDMILKSLAVGLTRHHIQVNDDTGFNSDAKAYEFTERLVTLIEEIFGEQRSQGLFLCQFGSQRTGETIDDAFTSRQNAMRTGGHHTPTDKEKVAFVDDSKSLHDYLEQAMIAAKVQDMQVRSLPPYAYIGCAQTFEVGEPEAFETVTGITNRHAAKFFVRHRLSGMQFPVICNQSPTFGSVSQFK